MAALGENGRPVPGVADLRREASALPLVAALGLELAWATAAEPNSEVDGISQRLLVVD